MFQKNDAEQWKKEGWYDYPVVEVYALDGRTEVIAKESLKEWKKEGWYEEPVSKIYTPEGAEVIIPKKEMAELIKKGWTTEKVEKKKTEYFTYRNSRYGYSIDVPTFLENKQYSDNGDGGSFYTDDNSVRLIVYGCHHLPDLYSPMITNIKELFEHEKSVSTYPVSYSAQKNNWFVLSGDDRDEVIYEKGYLKSDNTINRFIITYPKSREKEFDEIVTHIAKSFITGRGADSSVEK